MMMPKGEGIWQLALVDSCLRIIRWIEDDDDPLAKPTKQYQVEKLTDNLLYNHFVPNLKKKIERALKSSAIDVEDWDPNEKMILPKTILIACVEAELQNYLPTGTRFEKQMKKDIKNLKLFL